MKNMKKEQENTLLAVLLGVLVTGIALHATYATKSSVMFVMTAHGVASTISLLLLYCVIHSGNKEERGLNWVSGGSGYFLYGAGVLSVMFGLWRMIQLLAGNIVLVKEPTILLLSGASIFVLIGTQLYLTKNIRHLIHGHVREEVADDYIWKTQEPSHTTKAVNTGLLVDLIQSTLGIVVGLTAMFFATHNAVSYVDTLFSIILGSQMMMRGCTILIDR